MPRSGQQSQAYQQRAGFTSALVQSKEQTKSPGKTQQVAPATAEAAQPEGKQDTVEADRRPPDPGLRPEAGSRPQVNKVPTTRQVYESQHTPGLASTTTPDPSAIHLPAMQISDYTSYDVTRSYISDLQGTLAEPTMANVWVKLTIGVNHLE